MKDKQREPKEAKKLKYVCCSLCGRKFHTSKDNKEPYICAVCKR